MKVNNAHGKRKNVRFLVLLLAMVIAAILPVTASAASTVRLNRKKVTLTVGKTARLKVTGTRRTVKWSSSDKKVATVSKKGKLTGKKKGSAVITARVGNKKLKCRVVVRNARKKVTKVTLNRSSITLKLKKNKTARLKATVKGARAAVKWSSSNRRVASVNSSGKVTAKGAGKATITAKAGGKSAKCTVTVKKASAASSGKTTMYLLQAYSYYAWSGDHMENATYTYNADGLLAECKSKRHNSGPGSTSKNTYTYDREGNITRVHYECKDNAGYTNVSDYSLTYSNGHKSRCVENLYMKNSSGLVYNQYSITWDYFYSQNRLVKQRCEYHNYNPNFIETRNFTYSSSGKRPAAVDSAAYKYDNKGNIQSIQGRISDCGNKYASGKLISRKYKENENTSMSYRYIKVKVPAKMKNKVREQQWALLNDNLNAALEPGRKGYVLNKLF